jgi:hypothetical protein
MTLQSEQSSNVPKVSAAETQLGRAAGSLGVRGERSPVVA